jgi:hypothetical protein
VTGDASSYGQWCRFSDNNCNVKVDCTTISSGSCSRDTVRNYRDQSIEFSCTSYLPPSPSPSSHSLSGISWVLVNRWWLYRFKWFSSCHHCYHCHSSIGSMWWCDNSMLLCWCRRSIIGSSLLWFMWPKTTIPNPNRLPCSSHFIDVVIVVRRWNCSFFPSIIDYYIYSHQYLPLFHSPKQSLFLGTHWLLVQLTRNSPKID